MSEVNNYDKLIEKYNLEVAEFFEVKPLKNIEVVIFENQKKIIDYYNKYNPYGNKAPDYLVGFSPENKIFIVDPKNMPSDSDPGPIRFKKVLKHEIVHKYIYRIPGKAPAWLVEGTCCFIAGQSKHKIAHKDLSLKILDDLSTTQSGMKYPVGQNIVNEIVKSFGKERLIELLKLENNDLLLKELKKMFDWLK